VSYEKQKRRTLHEQLSLPIAFSGVSVAHLNKFKQIVLSYYVF